MNNKFNIPYDLLVILGPTATGKTKLAVQIADKFQGEILSADSRQVYKGMDIGTGKDLDDYKINGKNIPYHLIDIITPKEEYNVYQFQKDFKKSFLDIQKRNKIPILCGGTGLYLKAIIMDFQLPSVKPNDSLRKELEDYTRNELINKLESVSPGASKINLLDTKRRIIRAIEIEMITKGGKVEKKHHQFPSIINNLIVMGIEYERSVIKHKITQRLHDRLNNGMIQEVETLIQNGITHQKLESLGLEYRYISLYLQKRISKEQMIEKLNIAIHQFSKRQMTFFRNIEKNGTKIHWLSKGNLDVALKLIT